MKLSKEELEEVKKIKSIQPRIRWFVKHSGWENGKIVKSEDIFNLIKDNFEDVFGDVGPTESYETAEDHMYNAIRGLFDSSQKNNEKNKPSLFKRIDDGQYQLVLDSRSIRNVECPISKKNAMLFDKGVKQMILTGAPGTGKTYLAKEIARQIIISELYGGSVVYDSLAEDKKAEVNHHIGFVQFHPSYDYTDFVEGLRPTGIDSGQLNFGKRDGIFKEFCKKAVKDYKNKKKVNEEANRFIFIIDEINRAEISKVFGELMY